jgi:hypothetical protein
MKQLAIRLSLGFCQVAIGALFFASCRPVVTINNSTQTALSIVTVVERENRCNSEFSYRDIEKGNLLETNLPPNQEIRLHSKPIKKGDILVAICENDNIYCIDNILTHKLIVSESVLKRRSSIVETRNYPEIILRISNTSKESITEIIIEYNSHLGKKRENLLAPWRSICPNRTETVRGELLVNTNGPYKIQSVVIVAVKGERRIEKAFPSGFDDILVFE